MALENSALEPAEGKTLAMRTTRDASCGLANANRSVRSAEGSPMDLGPSTWSDTLNCSLAGSAFRTARHHLRSDSARCDGSAAAAVFVPLSTHGSGSGRRTTTRG